MQPPPPPSPTGMPQPRSRFGLLLAIGVLALVAAAGLGGFVIGSSGIGHATLRIQVTNHAGSNVTAQVTVNGALAATATIAPGQTASMDVPVSYATANGATFDVEATTTQGPRDSSSVFVNTPGIFVVNLQLG